MAEQQQAAGIRAAFNRLPLRAAFLLVVAVWVGASLVFRSSDHPVTAREVALRVLGGCVIASFAVWRIRGARKRLGGPDQVWSFARSARSGEVPPDVDRSAWRAQIAWQRTRIRRAYWLSIPLGLLIAATGVWAVVAVPRAAIAGWFLVLLFAALVVVTVVGAARLRRRLDRLEAALDR